VSLRKQQARHYINTAAESVADGTRRPLYTISSGDLGTDANLVETRLSYALALATSWNAVVLIDEADVFLEERKLHDLKRNGLISGKLSSWEDGQQIDLTFVCSVSPRLGVLRRHYVPDYESSWSIRHGF
jgi:hypothetical protein